MRRYVFGLLLPALFGCSGQNVVAGEEKTKAEQLEASLPAWCDSTCSRLTDCSSLGVNTTCAADCKVSFGALTKDGEACAVVGERIKKCIDRASCVSLSQGDPCALTEAERAMCPDPNGSTDTPSSTGANYGYAGSASTGDNSAPSGTGGSITYAGSANLPTAGTSSGGAYAGPSGPPVKCMGSYGSGGGAPAAGGSHVICEEGLDGCSDGHAYNWICVEGSQGEHACSCLLDSGVTGGFDPGASCPDVSAVNSGCGWNLDK